MTSSLKAESVMDLLRQMDALESDLTRQSWADLARYYGGMVTIYAHPEALERFEAAQGLRASARPRWVLVARHMLDKGAFYFTRCDCYCHVPDEPLPLRAATPDYACCCVCSDAPVRLEEPRGA